MSMRQHREKLLAGALERTRQPTADEVTVAKYKLGLIGHGTKHPAIVAHMNERARRVTEDYARTRCQRQTARNLAMHQSSVSYDLKKRGVVFS